MGLCNGGIQLWGLVWGKKMGGHGKKIIICDDPCDGWGGEDWGFQGAGEVWEEARGFLVFEPPLFNSQFAESEMNFKCLLGERK